MGLFLAAGYLIGRQQGMLIAFLLAAGMNFFAYWNADKMVLRMYNAQQVDDSNAPEFVGMVRELAGRAGLPTPKVYLIDEHAPNAFATGRNPDNAAVAAIGFAVALPSGAPHLFGAVARDAKEVFQPAAL